MCAETFVRMSDNVSEPLDRARAGRILPEGNVSPYLIIIIGRIFRKNSQKMLCVERDQMVKTFVPDRPDQALKEVFPLGASTMTTFVVKQSR